MREFRRSIPLRYGQADGNSDGKGLITIVAADFVLFCRCFGSPRFESRRDCWRLQTFNRLGQGGGQIPA